ncbi:HPr(Ser) kinase/phosphatase [Facklamia hominis]|uniref:HPr kinase/phosphorylase n=1 Tax=Facklamia hominis CCUG 36813 TaxID=883111 RepID=K1MFZ4_9LACT|nr:HPr(Ser) kinase/phosphatase [Facklamia hominis]EKB54954.1 HPr(Ser) kinase/phosphatase [Facklamia hominis CCUG 36813]EPH08808.1 HPr(Ser) kinase/phosphatase [Facklamia hominis ACS-120-V-Sch10]PKY93664.1 HPr kinase/phosphorylase [Facklamia hominis]RYC98357.1 HPr kinase/phosphorylase [Facklamia hominis]WPJ90793.1 HPr(Ser) kinase/phosphatase [Facklamia hominis]
MNKYVTVEELVDTLDVKLVAGAEFMNRQIISSEVSRPGLILAGFKDYYPSERIQLIGRTEIAYLQAQSSQERIEKFRLICRHDTPAIVIARGIVVPAELALVSNEMKVPVLSARSKTSRVLANLTNYLEGKLAERFSKHGVFLEVFGMGVLITGTSGVGKSETALELIQRGHRLIADDRVEFYMIDELTLIGEAPEILQNLLEIRGLGIVDVMSLYGVSAIVRSKSLELIIEMVLDDGQIEYDRLGSKQEYERIFDVQIPRIRIPVKSGRNLAAIIEAAAMNFRATQMGYDATESFNQKLDALIRANREG